MNVTLGDTASFSSINYAGGLVGSNLGSITSSSASGNVTVGTNGEAGGLAGQNGGAFFNGGTGTITNSFATANVSGKGFNAGGLVGFNDTVGTITDSHATGNVSTTLAAIGNCSNGNCQSASAGGLVGANEGIITSSDGNYRVYATGNVSVGTSGIAGGLVGGNSGLILGAYATGTVTGAAGTTAPGGDVFGQPDHPGRLRRDQHGPDRAGLRDRQRRLVQCRSLDGWRVCRRQHGDHRRGLRHRKRACRQHQPGRRLCRHQHSSECDSCSSPGSYFNSAATIGYSYSTGNVSVGSESIAGGFAGSGSTIVASQSSGNVTGGGNSILGGFVGIEQSLNDFAATGLVSQSTSSGSVTSTGPNSWVGGFVGLNAGIIQDSTATGAVSGTASSVLGGFVAMNLGLVDPSFARGSVSASGGGNVLGGFAGVNFGTIDQGTATGPVTAGGANNILGGLVGANAQFINFPFGSVPFSSFPAGTTSRSTGSPGLDPVGVSFPTTLPGYPALITQCGNGVCEVFRTGILGGGPADRIPTSVLAPPAVFVPTIPKDNTALIPVLIALTTSTGGGGATPSTGGPARYIDARPGVAGFTPAPFPLRPNGEISGMPPLGETRFAQNELLLRLTTSTMGDALRLFLQGLNMRVVSIDALGALGGGIARIGLPPGMSVRRAIALIEANPATPVVSTNSLFKFGQANAGASKGDPAQYTIGKFELEKTHKIATGKGVTVAVIDSEVDKRHTELQGTISEELDTLGVKEPPHSHGTAMAGAIGSHDKLLGIAPGARIIAVRAFGESNNTAEGTTLSILKGIEWAVSQGARVVNMSFAGPRDPSLERALKAAHDKGIMLVAAAGNAGPKSPPLYPGADPHVIAVTATDVRDRGFRGANQGPQLSVAAPGVDILAPAPEETYQMSTGTSIATAHVSGVVALMLERDPTLTPAEVRRILEETATDLGPKGKDAQFGWGLVNPQKALQAVEARLKSSDASKAKP